MSDRNLTNLLPGNYVTAKQKSLIAQESYFVNIPIVDIATNCTVGISNF